jgi:hypothetical protein
MGFPIPARKWPRGELYGPVRELLESREVRERGIYKHTRRAPGSRSAPPRGDRCLGPAIRRNAVRTLDTYAQVARLRVFLAYHLQERAHHNQQAADNRDFLK